MFNFVSVLGLVSTQTEFVLPGFYDPTGIIQLHPESQAVTLNSTVRLQCRVRMLVDPDTGLGAQVYWSKNDFGIGGNREDIQEYGRSQRYEYSRYDLPYNLKEGQYDLQITNVELSDEGAYVCQVNFMKQQYLSQTAVLTVHVPSEAPQLIQVTQEGHGGRVELGPSRPATVDDGTIMVLECIARHGKPGARLTWSIDGVPLKLEPSVDGKPPTFQASFSGNLTTSMIPSGKIPRLMDSISRMSAPLNKLHHGKLIECLAENDGYEMHTLRPAQTKLEVYYAPVVSIQILPPRPDNLYTEHDFITVECSAHGRPDTFYWEWFVNGRQVENIAESWYRFRLTREMHNAVVRCIAISNKKGHAETTISVKFGPQFHEPSALLFTASPGEDVAMDCPARGNPTPFIEWRREGGREILSRGVTLKRENLREDDFGTYICTAFVADFPPVSKQMYIARRKPPRIQPNPVVHAQLGQPVRLRCTVNSVPLPPATQTHWYFQGHAVQPDSHHTFEKEEFIGGVVLILHIAHVMMTDFGHYNCSVSNGYGSDWKLIRLSHQEDIPMQFIIGAAVAVGILLTVGLILLCICRQRVCGVKYSKGNHTTRESQSGIPDYGVVNTDFKIQACVPGNACGSENYQYYPGTLEPNKSYSQYGHDPMEQGSLNRMSKDRSENYFFDASKDDICTNSSMPVSVSGAYCSNYASCQLLQPLCNGGTYIPTINSHLVPTDQPNFLAGCPTILTSSGVVHAQPPDFIPESLNLQACDQVGTLRNNCLFSASGHLITNLPQITTLDLTSGINSQGLCSADSTSGRSSLEVTRTPISSHSTRGMIPSLAVSPDPLSVNHSDQSGPKVQAFTTLPCSSVSSGLQSPTHGIAYLINDHTTNV